MEGQGHLAGFPGGHLRAGTQATREFAVQLLREIGSGERLTLAMSTENQVTNENLLALTAILENLELPLTPEAIDRIAHSAACFREVGGLREGR